MAFQAGQRVEAKWDSDEYYPATIKRVNPSGSLSLSYDGGGFWENAPSKVIKPDNLTVPLHYSHIGDTAQPAMAKALGTVKIMAKVLDCFRDEDRDEDREDRKARKCAPGSGGIYKVPFTYGRDGGRDLRYVLRFATCSRATKEIALSDAVWIPYRDTLDKFAGSALEHPALQRELQDWPDEYKRVTYAYSIPDPRLLDTYASRPAFEQYASVRQFFERVQDRFESGDYDYDDEVYTEDEDEYIDEDAAAEARAADEALVGSALEAAGVSPDVLEAFDRICEGAIF